jgi:S1-C subfamily serine protease
MTGPVHRTPFSRLRRSLYVVTFLSLISIMVPITLAAAQTEVDHEREVLPAVVQIAVRIIETENGQTEEQLVPRGSGSVVSPNGVVLTADHVLDITDLQNRSAAREADFLTQGRNRTVRVVEDQYVLLFSERDEPPRALYTAEIVTTDTTLDLAVLRIVGGSMRQHVENLNLTFLPLGDSDQVNRRDRIWVVGYPGITQTSITDDGTVNAIETEPGIMGRAWIVTDAVVSGGSSGGPAVNEAGQIVGITTTASEPECRPGDTNHDGVTDELDVGCIPVGSAVARLRPVNLAKPLLEDFIDLVTPVSSPSQASMAAPTPTPSSEPKATSTIHPPASPTPTPIEGTVVYRDDFSDADTSLIGQQHVNLDVIKYFMGEEYVIEKINPENREPFSSYLTGTYRDVMVAVDVRLMGDTAERLVHVTCRRGPEFELTNAYRLTVEPATGSYSLERWQDGAAANLDNGSRPDIVAPGKAVNRVEIRCIGTEIVAAINGVEVAHVEDAAWTEGRVGIGVGVLKDAHSTTVEARFDNVEVRIPVQATPTPVEEHIAYRDDFDGPQASLFDTNSNDPASQRYRLDDGEFVFEKIDQRSDSILAKYLPGIYHDVVVTVDARLVNETRQQYVQVACRVNRQQNFEGYGLAVRPDFGMFFLGRWEAGVWTNEASAVRQDVIRPGDEVNRIELRCIGTEIVAVINGVVVALVEDSTLSEGGVGIGSGNYNDVWPRTFEARFDNFALNLPEQVRARPIEGDIAYRDEFGDPDASEIRIESEDSERYQYRLEGGELLMEKIDPTSDRAVVRPAPGTYRDVIVTVDTRLVGETDDRSVFVMCRAHGESEDYNAYRLVVEPGSAIIELVQWQNGNVSSLALAVRQDAIVSGTAVNRLELRCIGSEIVGVVNGVEVARAEDTAPAEGHTLIGAYVDNTALPGVVEARFDNLQVTSPIDLVSIYATAATPLGSGALIPHIPLSRSHATGGRYSSGSRAQRKQVKVRQDGQDT